MEHGLYLKLEKIVDKLANEKGCMVKVPEIHTETEKQVFLCAKIPFGKNKGQMEYYNNLKAMEFTDFLKKCFAILPRDNLMQLSNGSIKKTGVTMDTLLSDKPCSSEERIKQKLTINNFFYISQFAGDIRICHTLYRSKNWRTKNCLRIR